MMFAFKIKYLWHNDLQSLWMATVPHMALWAPKNSIPDKQRRSEREPLEAYLNKDLDLMHMLQFIHWNICTLPLQHLVLLAITPQNKTKQKHDEACNLFDLKYLYLILSAERSLRDSLKIAKENKNQHSKINKILLNAREYSQSLTWSLNMNSVGIWKCIHQLRFYPTLPPRNRGEWFFSPTFYPRNDFVR